MKNQNKSTAVKTTTTAPIDVAVVSVSKTPFKTALKVTLGIAIAQLLVTGLVLSGLLGGLLLVGYLISK